MGYRSVCRKGASGLFAAFLLALLLAFGAGCAAETSAPPEGAAGASVQAAPAEQGGSAGLSIAPRDLAATTQVQGISSSVASVEEAGAFDGQQPGAYVNGNIPQFADDELSAAYGTEEYGELDSLGRCTRAFALAGPETQPTAKRGNISSIHPSGWHQARYPDLRLDHLYERSHLIAHCLTAEDANECNLMTGTEYMNQGAMQALEQVMDRYIDATGGHVLIEVTPVYAGDELVARGVHMQGYSVEDDGESACFNVYLHNAQPGVEIDYATGASRPAAASADASATSAASADASAASGSFAAPATAHHVEAHHDEPAASAAPTCSYVLNTNTHKFHYPDCASVKRMKDKNKGYLEGTRDEAIAAGYSPCGNCCP